MIIIKFLFFYDLIVLMLNSAIIVITLVTINASIKILGGIFSGSLSLLADGLDSSINIVTVIMAYYFYTRSKRPPDTEHRYGHYGFEDISLLILSLFLIALGTMVILTSFIKLEAGHIISKEAIWYAVISTITLIISYLILYISGLKTSSIAIRSESQHIMIDLIESMLVLGGVSLAVSISPFYDLVVASVIGVLMYIIASYNISRIYKIVTHKMPEIELDKKIKKIALSINGVKECHKIRARDVGGRIFLDLHILVNDRIDVMTAHEIAHKVESEIKSKIVNIEDIIVHIEPFKEHK